MVIIPYQTNGSRVLAKGWLADSGLFFFLAGHYSYRHGLYFCFILYISLFMEEPCLTAAAAFPIANNTALYDEKN